MNLAKSSLKIFGAGLITSLTSIFAVIIFSRELGASPLGTYYPFLALLGIFAIPADFGIRSAVEKRISEGQDASSYLGTAIALKILPLSGIAVAIVFAKPYVNQYLGANLVIPLVVALFLRETGTLGLLVLRGELRVGETATAKILRPLGWLVVGYYFYAQGFGVHGLVYGYLVGSAAMLVVAWWKVSTPIGRPTLQHAKSLIDYGRYSVVSAVGGFFYSWMDVAILTAFVATGIAATRAQIGAYENAWRLSMVTMLFSRAIATTLFPQISQWDAQDATDRIENVIPTAMLPALLLVIPAFAGTAVLAKDLLGILFGSEFTVAWLALIILTAEKILQSIHIVLGRSLQAINRPDLAAYATVVAVVVNLVLNVVLIWHFGIAGAAVATAFSFAVNTALHARYLNQFLDIELPVREAGWSVVASTVMGVAVYAVRSMVDVETIPYLLLVIAFGAGVYASILFVYAPVRTTVWDVLKPMVPKQIV